MVTIGDEAKNSGNKIMERSNVRSEEAKNGIIEASFFGNVHVLEYKNEL